jgi:hypothetical protein
MSVLSLGESGWGQQTGDQTHPPPNPHFLENGHGFISSNRGNSSRNKDACGFGIGHFRASYGEDGIGSMGNVLEQANISRLPGAQQLVLYQ